MKIKKEMVLIFPLLFLFASLTFAHWGPNRIADSVRNFLDNAIRIGAVLGFLSLAWAGFLWITSAGSVEKIANAKKQVLSTFVGLMLLFAGFMILRTIKPEFVGIEPVPLDFIPNLPGELKMTEDSYLAYAEIPIETFLKGPDNGSSSYFNLTELEDLKNFLKLDFLNLIEGVQNDFTELVSAVSKCYDRCKTLTAEGGIRYCRAETKTVDTSTYTICKPDPCTAERCNGRDPCEGLREEWGEIMKKIAHEKNPELFEKMQELREKLFLIKERFARLVFALDKIKNCPFTSAVNRDVFSFTRDYLVKNYPQVNWKISRINLFEGIENPRKDSIADFYCPKMGFYYMTPDPEQIKEEVYGLYGIPTGNFSLEEIINFIEKSAITSQAFREFYEKVVEAEKDPTTSPEYELDVSCPFSVPFGEIMDEFLKVLGDIIKKINTILDSADKIMPAINDYYKLTSECKAENCEPSCSCQGGGDNPVCTCVCECKGNPCPLLSLMSKSGEVNSNIMIIKNQINTFDFSKIKDWVENWPDIEKKVRARETALTKRGIERLYNAYSSSVHEIIGFEIMASRMHYTIAQGLDVESGWTLTDCLQYKEGSLSPDGQRVNKPDDCDCAKTKECVSSYPFLNSYNCEYLAPGAGWLADLISKIIIGIDTSECRIYNYFSCRPLEKK